MLLEKAKECLKKTEIKLSECRKQWEHMDNHGSTPAQQSELGIRIEELERAVVFYKRLVNKLSEDK